MYSERNKSDKTDAKHICMYGIERKPEQYQMPDGLYFECRALNNAIHTMTQEVTSFKNKIHALKKVAINNKIILKSYEKIIKELTQEFKKLDTELNEN